MAIKSWVARPETPQSQDDPKAGSWELLPWGIRCVILKEVTQQKGKGWGSLASVSKEWQHVIAPENLRSITMPAWMVPQFGRLVQQKHLVRHIRLGIELQRFICENCHTQVDRFEEDGYGFMIGLQKLFRILKGLEKSEHGLTLELNVYVVKDYNHWFHRNHFHTGVDAYLGATRHRRCAMAASSWRIDDRSERDPDLPKSQIFWNLEQPFLPSELHDVQAVTRFILRRQMRRSISSAVLRQILGRLRCLEDFVYEDWIARYSPRREQDQIGANGLIDLSLPPTLKRLCAFENFDMEPPTRLPAGTQGSGFIVGSFQRRLRTTMAAAFAQRSITLEHLASSYSIEAVDFFAACKQDWVWEKLEFLALTSHLLQESTEPERLDDLLRSAGRTALQMPKVQKMLLWYGDEEFACAFSYAADRDGACITWRGEWAREFSPSVVSVWRDVGLRWSPHQLRVRRDVMNAWTVSQDDPIDFLSGTRSVVEPTSVWEMQREDD